MDGRPAPEGQPLPGGGTAPLPASGRPTPRPLSRDRVRPGAPRVAALDALLRDVDALRTTLQTDLSLAAGALEAGEPVLAASVLDSDRHDVAAFERRALGHLAALQAADLREAEAARTVAPVLALAARPDRTAKRGLPRRLTRLLPAAPLVAAAAALVGIFGVPGTTPRVEPTSDVSGAVLSSWAELTRLSASDAPADQVQRAAQSLNADIASMVAGAGGDPAAARQALALLREAQVVLQNDDDAAQLQTVLQQSRVLAARLLASLPPVAPAPAAPAPVRSAVERLPEVTAPLPLPQPSQATPRPAAPRRTQAARPATSPVPSPRASSSPSARPAPPPSAGPTQADPLPRPSRPSLPTAGIDPPLS